MGHGVLTVQQEYHLSVRLHSLPSRPHVPLLCVNGTISHLSRLFLDYPLLLRI